MSRFGKMTIDQLTDCAAEQTIEIRPGVNTTLIEAWNAAVAHAGVNIIAFARPVKIIGCTLLVTTAIASGSPNAVFSLGISGAATAIVNAFAVANAAAGTVYNPPIVSNVYTLPANTPIIATTTVNSATGGYKAWLRFKNYIETDSVL